MPLSAGQAKARGERVKSVAAVPIRSGQFLVILTQDQARQALAFLINAQ